MMAMGGSPLPLPSAIAAAPDAQGVTWAVDDSVLTFDTANGGTSCRAGVNSDRLPARSAGGTVNWGQPGGVGGRCGSTCSHATSL